MEHPHLRIPIFRNGIPVYRAPDRDQWARDHAAPYELSTVPGKFTSRAAAAVARDGDTISFEDAVKAKVAMDAVIVSMEAQGVITGPLSANVYFDPSTHSFWVYPFSNAA